VDLGMNVSASQDWKVPHPPRARQAVIDAIGRSYKIVITVGRLVLAVCYWPEPTWPLVPPLALRDLAARPRLDDVPLPHRRSRLTADDAHRARGHDNRDDRLLPAGKPVSDRGTGARDRPVVESMVRTCVRSGATYLRIASHTCWLCVQAGSHSARRPLACRARR
jgi:hypothetical protein